MHHKVFMVDVVGVRLGARQEQDDSESTVYLVGHVLLKALCAHKRAPGRAAKFHLCKRHLQLVSFILMVSEYLHEAWKLLKRQKQAISTTF